MQKIVPFKKDIDFKTNINEITSISLDHDFNIQDNVINGSFKISGEYKALEASPNEPFEYNLPFTVELDDKYVLDKASIDIDDFYYEIASNDTLRVGIDVMIDNLDEKEIKEEIEEERCVEEEKEEVKEEVKEENDEYKNYIVYIVREDDSIEKIMAKYSITKEILNEYNNIEVVKAGDKIIIPSL